MSNKVILPVRLDSYAGETSALEAHLFNDKEEYGNKSVPDDSMWIAVYIVNGKIDHSQTDYGYRSLDELLKTYKNEKIIGLRENRNDAELERARDIAEDTLETLLTEDSVLLHIEGELNLAPGAIKKAYRTIRKARTGGAKVPLIDRDEVYPINHPIEEMLRPGLYASGKARDCNDEEFIDIQEPALRKLFTETKHASSTIENDAGDALAESSNDEELINNWQSKLMDLYNECQHFWSELEEMKSGKQCIGEAAATKEGSQ